MSRMHYAVDTHKFTSEQLRSCIQPVVFTLSSFGALARTNLNLKLYQTN